ncbi:MAG: hypothetical protein JSW60_04000 [Thermoplasmatales archaeon]|nr:MAG: hypothetical protein JSW60_04000 [Thermoplasmatales archaeon]
MRKKILMGSMLVLTLLLLMPSISALQQKTIEEKTFTDLVEKFDDDLKEIKELNNLGDDVKFPNLYEFLARFLALRFFRGLMLCLFGLGFMEFAIYEKFPIFNIRGVWLSISTFFIADYIDGIVEKLGWNWEPLTDWIG